MAIKENDSRLSAEAIRERIAKRAAAELNDGDVVNLGIGLPTFIANYIPDGMTIYLQSENGIIGMGPAPDETNFTPNQVNAGGKPVTVVDGASFFDSSISFSIIRGGHVDMAVLGALQVDMQGNLASHMVPGKKVPGMGGAMDLVTGAKRVIIAMSHTTAAGEPKILKQITLPTTAVAKVQRIITELAVIDVTPEGLLLQEIATDTTVEEVIAKTAAPLIPAENMGRF